ncbi:MAG: carbohydrate kinase [Bacteroidales bacterium]|nr:carbohydrate kinase [Bacteroidales bacterium]MBN2821190.1 carbohydrate kinase [Bacteroidales bacterium]
MGKIYTIGETVLDILFRANQPFAAKAGGASLNSAVSLGRLGLPVNFIGEYGLDEVGNYIDRFLKDNNVSTEYVYRYFDGKSALALAFLNEKNDANYDFYKIFPKKRLHIRLPEILPDDIVLFGSFYAITVEVRETLIRFIKQANKQKAIVLYDPNFRKPHLHELSKLKPLIIENIEHSNILRGSNEDFSFVFGTRNADDTYELLKDKCPILLYTASTKGVYLKTPKISEKFEVDLIEPISTIGAGDNFNAGIVYSLFKHNINLKKLLSLTLEEWSPIIETAIKFASHVCTIYDNYIEAEFAEKFKINA